MRLFRPFITTVMKLHLVNGSTQLETRFLFVTPTSSLQNDFNEIIALDYELSLQHNLDHQQVVLKVAFI